MCSFLGGRGAGGAEEICKLNKLTASTSLRDTIYMAGRLISSSCYNHTAILPFIRNQHQLVRMHFVSYYF